MNLRQLEHFESVYRLRSFSDAAQEHGVTQPALSRSLKALEEDLGQPLFDRSTHSVEPTTAAQGLIKRTREVLAAVQALREEASRLSSGTIGHIRIGTGPYPARPLLPRAIERLAASHSGVQVSVVGGPPRELLAALLGRELDCVVCDLSKYEDAPAAAELEAVALTSEPLVVVFSPSRTDLLVDPPPSLERLVEIPWAMPILPPSGARELPPPFAEAWAAGRFPFFCLESTDACLDLARTGRALTLVPRSLALDACRTGDLVYRPALGSLRTRDGVHWLKNRTPSPATALMIAAIRMTADEIASTPDGPSATAASSNPLWQTS